MEVLAWISDPHHQFHPRPQETRVRIYLRPETLLVLDNPSPRSEPSEGVNFSQYNEMIMDRKIGVWKEKS